MTANAKYCVHSDLSGPVTGGSGRQARGGKSLRLLLGACVALAPISAAVAAGDAEARWRVSGYGDDFVLAITTTEDATDDLGSPYFRCRRGSGTIEVGGIAKPDLRAAMADVIRADEYPVIHISPIDSGDNALISFSYNEMREGWQYSFSMSAAGPSFDAFKLTGRLAFKVGATVVIDEFKAGLENITKFQNICKQPPKTVPGRSN